MIVVYHNFFLIASTLVKIYNFLQKYFLTKEVSDHKIGLTQAIKEKGEVERPPPLPK
jgi:hypothetical protein